jgi:ribosomal protein S18 acetylase RimI-like enzyme
MKIKIRKGTKKDIIQIAKVEEKSGYHFGKWNFIQDSEDLFKNKNEKVFVAEINSKIVGYRSFNKKRKLADSGYLAIIKKFQGKGIGKKLLKRSIREAKKLGCNKMVLHVRKNNFNAISLYEKLGFQKTKSEKKGRIIKLTMEKKL